MTDEAFNAWREREAAAGRVCHPVASIVYGGPTRWESFVSKGADRGKRMSAFVRIHPSEWRGDYRSKEITL